MQKYNSKLALFSLMATLFFSPLSNAEISGRWIGWGDWMFDGSGTHCNDVTFVFSENNQSLKRIGGRLDCDYVSMDEDPIEFKKENQQLLIDNEVIGSFNGKTYNWTEQYSENVKMETTIVRTANHLDYTENWYDKGYPLYNIHARLFLSE